MNELDRECAFYRAENAQLWHQCGVHEQLDDKKSCGIGAKDESSENDVDKLRTEMMSMLAQLKKQVVEPGMPSSAVHRRRSTA